MEGLGGVDPGAVDVVGWDYILVNENLEEILGPVWVTWGVAVRCAWISPISWSWVPVVSVAESPLLEWSGVNEDLLSVADVQVGELRESVGSEGVEWVVSSNVSFPWEPGIDGSEVEGVEGEGDVEVVVGEVEIQIGWNVGLNVGSVVLVVLGGICRGGVVSTVIEVPVAGLSDGDGSLIDESTGTVEDVIDGLAGFLNKVRCNSSRSSTNSGESEENGSGVFHLKIINY